MEDFYFKEGKNNDILTHIRKRKKKASKALVTRAMPVKKISPPREEMGPSSAPGKTTVPGGAAGGFGRGIEAKEMPAGRAPPGREAEEERIDPGKPDAYRVRPGDTIAKIARRFGTTSAVLMGLNTTRIEHPTILDAGIVIRVPKKSGVRRKTRKKRSRRAKNKIAARREPRKGRAATRSYRTHRVKRGDTLLKIARRYKTSAKLLMRLNRNTTEHPSFLEAGSKIKIPSSKKKRKKRKKKTALRKKRRKKSRVPKKSTPAKKQASEASGS
ncbi:MAG: LysM peptidoglycan-binding domain-containing protein [Nitrospinota bacterium]|nr:LysM peptidoglycan-binding domain-containing protein [Nitrospinota bacterium]